MKHIITFLVICLSIINTSCDNTRNESNVKPQTPKALQTESSLSEIESYSRGGDLVESLYDELADKTPELKRIEEEIKTLRENQIDSTESFKNYNGKSQSYYTSANNYTAQIQDSALRVKMKAIILGSLTKYNLRIAAHSYILESINKKNVNLNDLHFVLKLTRTLPLLEKYQSDNLTSVHPLAEFEQELNKTVKHLDSFVNK